MKAARILISRELLATILFPEGSTIVRWRDADTVGGEFEALIANEQLPDIPEGAAFPIRTVIHSGEGDIWFERPTE